MIWRWSKINSHSSTTITQTVFGILVSGTKKTGLEPAAFGETNQRSILWAIFPGGFTPPNQKSQVYKMAIKLTYQSVWPAFLINWYIKTQILGAKKEYSKRKVHTKDLKKCVISIKRSRIKVLHQSLMPW